MVSQGKYAEAGPLYERSLTIRKKVLDPDHPEIAISLNNCAGLLQEKVRAVRIVDEISGVLWVCSAQRPTQHVSSLTASFALARHIPGQTRGR